MVTIIAQSNPPKAMNYVVLLDFDMRHVSRRTDLRCNLTNLKLNLIVDANKKSMISSSLSFYSFQVAIFPSCIASTKVPSFLPNMVICFRYIESSLFYLSIKM